MHQSAHRPEPPPRPGAKTQPTPHGAELRAEFDDLESLCATVSGWDVDFRPLVLDAPSTKVARIVQQQHGELAIAYARFRASIDQLGAPPAGSLTFAVLGEATRRLWWRGRDLDADSVMAFPVDGELRSLSGPDFEVYTVSVPEQAAAQLAEHLQRPLPPPSRRVETFRPPPGTLAELRRGLGALRRGAGHQGLDATGITETLVLAWLQAHAPAHPQPAVGGRLSARQRDRAIRACLARLENPDWSELSPSRLCEVGGVAERTLQYAFRERFDLTPAAFLKARRLGAVRQALLRRAPEQSVADIATGFGFWHTGQFAADYRRAFGEAPSVTRVRGVGPR